MMPRVSVPTSAAATVGEAMHVHPINFSRDGYHGV